MRVIDFDFPLPNRLIADRPAVPRDSCRLLVLRKDGSVEHRRFSDLSEFLNEGDLLLLNNTKVLPAKILGNKQTGGKIDILFVKETGPGVWEVMTRERYTGKVFIRQKLLGEMFQGKIITIHPGTDLIKTLWENGVMPLPPYIKRRPDEMDRNSYQTVYAKSEGSIAAPTAGLHFTAALLRKLQEKGVLVRTLTLHVGIGTFKPIRVQELEEHTMEEEHFEMTEELPDTIRGVKESGRRLVAVGTTVTRAVEGFFSGRYRSGTPSTKGLIRGRTDIFIYPGYLFRAVDALITNFHLPGSTPLMLTSSLSGRNNLMEIYSHAVSMEYRFFSYGDAMLIL